MEDELQQVADRIAGKVGHSVTITIVREQRKGDFVNVESLTVSASTSAYAAEGAAEGALARAYDSAVEKLARCQCGPCSDRVARLAAALKALRADDGEELAVVH